MTQGWRILHDKELLQFCFPPFVVRMINSRGLTQTERVASTREM